MTACTTPAQRIHNQAVEYGFRPFELWGNDFRLTAFFKEGRRGRDKHLHVYLEGDGSPWRHRYTVAEDPTPLRPVMLKLMALDTDPALYLGRPCYHGHAKDRGCSPELWTGRRYGPEIVDSMAAGLTGFLAHTAYSHLALFGHSGGGTLALLLAPRFSATDAVVTLAGNLDPAAWTAGHHYSPLQGSLNPAGMRNQGWAEYHYFGSADLIVPPSIFEPIARRRTGARVSVLAGFDHGCCWERIWPAILAGLEAESRFRK